MVHILKETSRGIDQVMIEDEMLESREIFLTTDVTGESCSELIKQLMYLERKSSTAPITLYINSPGGDVNSGLAVYDCMALMKAPIKTVCIGTAASMGSILFLAGTEREMLPHSKIMIHDPSFASLNIGGKKPHEIQQQVDSLNKAKTALSKIIAERTGKPLKEIQKITQSDSYYTAEEAIRFGLATAICERI